MPMRKVEEADYKVNRDIPGRTSLLHRLFTKISFQLFQWGWTKSLPLITMTVHTMKQGYVIAVWDMDGMCHNPETMRDLLVPLKEMVKVYETRLAEDDVREKAGLPPVKCEHQK
jgi:hypothetical protein